MISIIFRPFHHLLSIKQDSYITRVPMNISAGTRHARELLVSLLVEALKLSQEGVNFYIYIYATLPYVLTMNLG